MGHLYGAILIPYDQLEARIGELEEHRNHEIIVYCRSGYRSQIACETLVKYNFTKVYNMLGGIIAWIDAGYPIWTTSHYVTVNIVEDGILLQIEPLLLYQTSCPCAQNQTCSSCRRSVNVSSSVMEQRENFTEIMVTYEVNGTERNITIVRTLLWSYDEFTAEANRTVDFMLTEVRADNSSMQFYSLHYLVHGFDWNLTLYTTLSTASSEIYNGSFTIMDYAPMGDSKVTTLEFVEINSSMTLSKLYAILGKVAKEIGKVYEKSADESLMPFVLGYSRMSEEAKDLSKLVEKRLIAYDFEILHSSAVLKDVMCGPCGCGNDECGEPPPPPGDGIGCLLCEIGCYLLCGLSCFAICAIFPPFCPFVENCYAYGCEFACTLACCS